MDDIDKTWYYLLKLYEEYYDQILSGGQPSDDMVMTILDVQHNIEVFVSDAKTLCESLRRRAHSEAIYRRQYDKYRQIKKSFG